MTTIDLTEKIDSLRDRYGDRYWASDEAMQDMIAHVRQILDELRALRSQRRIDPAEQARRLAQLLARHSALGRCRRGWPRLDQTDQPTVSENY